MNYYQGPPGRFYQPWAYIPVQPHIYPNYPPVDPNHPWIPLPYGNAPLLNGRQSETDGDQETNVDDERPNGGSFPPPGVGLPAASTMQQQPVYQVMPPFSNMYVGSIPSGVNVQGFVNSPIPYPHPYSAGMVAGSEMNTPSQTNSRSGRGSGKSTSGSKITGGEKSGNNTNDPSLNSQQLLTSPESNSTNDPSTPTLTSTMGPSHPPTNFMPVGPVQYSYPPYFPTAGPPPPHMSSAQHATGSHLYIPHSVPLYHASIYNPAPAAVFSTDNGIPHSAINSAPISMQPQTEMISNHESESNSFSAKETPLDDTYKNSNLTTESASFEEEDTQKKDSSFAQETSPASNDIGSENVGVSNDNDRPVSSEIPCDTLKDNSDTGDREHVGENSISPCETSNCLALPLVANEKVMKSDSNIESNVNAVKTNSVNDECKKVYDRESESAFALKNGLNSATFKNAVKVGTSNADVNAPITTQENGIDGSGRSSETESNDLKNNSSDPLNGRSSGSSDTTTGQNAVTDLKKENSEENPPVPSTKTWASLFHSSSSKSKTLPPTVTKTPEVSNNSNLASSFMNQNSEGHSTMPATSSFSNSYSMNGVHPVHSSQNKSSSYSRHSSVSSSSLADDTTLPKIGSLLKSYRLDHKAVNFEPRGLENRSNFCYVNAILQALLACPPFYNLMKCISTNLHNPKTKAASRQYFPIIESMAQFVEEFKPISQKARMREKAARKMDSFQELVPGKPFEPNSMLSVIQGNSLFTVGQQEDAQEFLTCLLNGLNDEMVELIQLADGNNNMNSRKPVQATVKMPPPKSNAMSNGDITSEVIAPDDSDSEWKQVSSRAKSNRPNNLALTRTPLSEIFRGQTRSRLQKIGDQTTNNIEPFFTLHLNIEKVSSVKEALEALFGQSPLEGVTSSRTNQEVDAWQQQTLEELPYVLLLHLKYFDFKHHSNTCTKILKNTEFPIDLKVEPKLISGRTKMPSMKSRQYKLFAVVYHDGKEATKGHYVTDVFHIGFGGWIRYDDAKVYNVSESDVLKPQLPRVPYLLYYRRCDTIAALMQPPFEKRM